MARVLKAKAYVMAKLAAIEALDKAREKWDSLDDRRKSMISGAGKFGAGGSIAAGVKSHIGKRLGEAIERNLPGMLEKARKLEAEGKLDNARKMLDAHDKQTKLVSRLKNVSYPRRMALGALLGAAFGAYKGRGGSKEAKKDD